MLDEGRIVAIGTPDEIKYNPDPRVQMFLNARLVPKAGSSRSFTTGSPPYADRRLAHARISMTKNGDHVRVKLIRTDVTRGFIDFDCARP
jgi:hypothetical protein